MFFFLRVGDSFRRLVSVDVVSVHWGGTFFLEKKIVSSDCTRCKYMQLAA